MYDLFSDDYDRFVNWADRLGYEMPFIDAQIQVLSLELKHPIHILDSACGTGMHAIALSKAGYMTSAADLFPQMVQKGKENAKKAGVNVDFKTAGFGEMAQAFGDDQFDLVLCLGNSLPHILTTEDFTNAIKDFSSVLRNNGILLIQNRNFDAVMKQKARWMEPQVHQTEGKEWLFYRFYDFLSNGLIRFNIVTMKHEMDADWQSHVSSTLLRPLLYVELYHLLEREGFREVHAYGSMEGEAFSPESSGNLIITARKS